MTPARFCTLALAIAGRRWKTRLGPMIGKCRTQVWEYAGGKRPVPEAVQLLMQGLASNGMLRDAGFRKQPDGTWIRPIDPQSSGNAGKPTKLTNRPHGPKER